MFMFEALQLDLPAEAFPRPHLLIMRQYLIFQLRPGGDTPLFLSLNTTCYGN